MLLLLLDESLRVQVFYDEPDCDYEDNICICVQEDCPEEEKIFKFEETNIYITAGQAEQLAQILLDASQKSRQARQERCG